MDVILKKHFWVVNLLVVGICAAFGGRAVAHLLEGAYLAGDDVPAAPRHMVPPPQPAHSKSGDEVTRRDIFCSGCAPIVETPVDDTGPQSNEPQKSSLQLELVSTMVCPSDESWSMAVIRDLSTKEKDPRMYNRGMKVATTDATVVAVVEKRVYLRNGGRLEYLELEENTPPPRPQVAASYQPPPSPGDIDVGNGISCSGQNCNIDRAVVDKVLSNTAALATAARVVPSFKDGKPNGFKLYAIRPNSIFGKIGLQNGDTVQSINGMDMSSPDKALEVYTKLRSASHLSVALERRGQNLTLDYTIR